MSAQPTTPIYGDERVVEQRFGLCVATLRTRRSRGGGPPFLKVGRRVMYRLDEVEAWLEAHRTGGEG